MEFDEWKEPPSIYDWNSNKGAHCVTKKSIQESTENGNLKF